MSFPAILAAADRRVDGFVMTITQDWHQGRTAYGGFSAALALTAARQVAGDGLPVLRSAQISFVGPLYGPVEVRARVLRGGKSATWVAADILRAGEVGLATIFVFMRSLESTLHLNSRPMPQNIVAVDEALPRVLERGPVFLRNYFDVRLARPPGGEPRPEMCLWVRSRERDGIDPATDLLLCADAIAPAVFPLIDPRLPISSMTWLANMLMPAPVTRDGWWLLRATGDYAEHGCASEVLDIWNANGEAVMTGMQSIAIFG